MYLSSKIESQLPGVIRENYPLFVDFMEAYYEYLEQTGKLLDVSDNILNYHDVDYLVKNNYDDFLENFRNDYLNIIPTSALVNKSLLTKHIKDLYAIRGTTKSFKLLFRILFNEDVSVNFNSDKILKVSDGKWYIRTVLRITTNDDPQKFIATKIVGQTSFATAVVEETNTNFFIEENSVNFFANFKYNELTVSGIKGKFISGETITATNIDGENLSGNIIGFLGNIEITNPGNLYNIGDPVLVSNGGSGFGATAVVEDVSKGGIVSTQVVFGGSGFTIDDYKLVNQYSFTPPNPPYFPPLSQQPNVVIMLCDTSGVNSLNTIVLDDDPLYLSNSITLNTVFSNFSTANIGLSSRICDAYNYYTLSNIGSISATQIINSGYGNNIPKLIPTQVKLYGNSHIKLENLGIVGILNISNPGLNYSVNDSIKFFNTYSTGFGLEARVSSVNSNGSIQSVSICLPSITGTANTTSNSVNIIGKNTLFTTELIANTDVNIPGSGTHIIINGQTKKVINIVNNTFLTVNSVFTNTLNTQKIFLAGMPIGGAGYTKNDVNGVFSIISSASNGNNAIIQIRSILGSSMSDIRPITDSVGKILKIKITNPGINYDEEPDIDLSGYGDGTATASSNILSGLYSYPGRYLNEDGMVSARRYIQSKDFYNNYTYTVKSTALVSTFYNFVKDILHPSGFKMIGISEVNINDQQNTDIKHFTTNVYITLT